VLTSSVQLGRAAMSLGDLDEADEVYDAALALATGRIGDRDVPLLHDAGIVAARRGEPERAVELWRRCAAATGREVGPGGAWVVLSARGLRWYPLMAAGHLARLRGDDEA